MSVPAVTRADLLDVDLPKAVWSRSARPITGRLSRAMFASMLLLVGLALPWPVIGLGLAITGVLGYVLIPVITDVLIGRHEAAIRTATAERAPALLQMLDKRVLITAFAPDAWVTLQRGRLLLASGDGRGAAQAFADTARVARQPQHPVLLGAQARALLLAGDRAAAKAKLAELEQQGTLSARDRLDLGVVLLGEASRAEQAREHLQAAYDALDGHPQAAAALALALARAEQDDRASELLEAAEAGAASSDVLAQESIKKARKALRGKKKKRKG